MATYEELVQQGYSRGQALRILEKGEGGGNPADSAKLVELEARIAALEAGIDGNI